jgi:hypothetical protein
VHGIAFHARPEFHNPFIADFSHQALQDFPSQILVGHFASAEAQAGFHLVAFGKKPQNMVSFGDVIVLVHVDAELYFLQDDLFLVLFCRPFLLFLLVEELAVIHDAANRGLRRGGNLYQIKSLFPGLPRCILRRHDAKLFAIRANHAYFTRADPLIHLNKAFIYAILLNPPGKLTLFSGIAGGATHMWQDLKIIAWVDGPDGQPRSSPTAIYLRNSFLRRVVGILSPGAIT